MKHKIFIVLLFAFITTAFATHRPNDSLKNKYSEITDTIPQICAYIPTQEMQRIHPFTTLLTNIFPDPNSYETYTGCYYQFYTKDEKPQIAIRLIKWESAQQAANEFKQQVQSHFDLWGMAPERLRGVADSAFFGFNSEDTSLCDECDMVAILGVYAMYISFKGQYEKVSRAAKKLSALNIIQLMYDRIPGLSPRRIRIYQ